MATMLMSEVVPRHGRPQADAPGTPAADVRSRRQAAASYLQASILADDLATRESLRRRAAALLAPGAELRRECAAC